MMGPRGTCQRVTSANGVGLAHHSGENRTAIAVWLPLIKKAGRFALCLLAMTSLWIGCTAVQVKDYSTTTTGVGPGESVTVVLNYNYATSESEARAAEDKISSCITKAIRKAHPLVRIVSAEEFRRTAFPDLDFGTAPRSPESIALLLNNPVFLERMAPLVLRYLVIVGGIVTEQRINFRGGRPSGGGGPFYPPGGTSDPYLYVFVDRNSQVGALILDIKQAHASGEVSVTASGHPWLVWVPAALPIPVGLPAFTESRACGELGKAVVEFIAGGNKPEP